MEYNSRKRVILGGRCLQVGSTVHCISEKARAVGGDGSLKRGEGLGVGVEGCALIAACIVCFVTRAPRQAVNLHLLHNNMQTS